MSDPAAARFAIISALRFAGVMMVMAGIGIALDKTRFPVEAGYALLAAGLFDVLVVPTLLAKRWRTRE